MKAIKVIIQLLIIGLICIPQIFLFNYLVEEKSGYAFLQAITAMYLMVTSAVYAERFGQGFDSKLKQDEKESQY